MQIKPVANYTISLKPLQTPVCFKSSTDSKRLKDTIFHTYAIEKKSGKTKAEYRKRLLEEITPNIAKALNLNKDGNTLNEAEQRRFNSIVEKFQIFNLEENGNKGKLHTLDPQNPKDVMEEFIVNCIKSDNECLSTINSIPYRLLNSDYKFHRKIQYKTTQDESGNILTGVFVKKDFSDKLDNALETASNPAFCIIDKICKTDIRQSMLMQYLKSLPSNNEIYHIKNGQVTRLYRTTYEIVEDIKKREPENFKEKNISERIQKR